MDQFKKHENLKPYFDNSYGCAAFSSVAKGGIFFVGGAYGAGDISVFTKRETPGSGL